jgi:hypothetical protein
MSHRIVVDLVLGFANARSVSPSDCRVIMAHVALPRCGSMRVIPWSVSTSPTVYLFDCQACCLLTTRAVVFYASSEELPVQKKQLLATQGSVLQDGTSWQPGTDITNAIIVATRLSRPGVSWPVTWLVSPVALPLDSICSLATVLAL